MSTPAPFIDDGDFVLHVGDVRDVLASLPDGSVNCVVTSPPYWGLRDYGTGLWEGGNPDCDHTRHVDYGEKSDTNRGSIRGGPMGPECDKCGASRVDQQLGLEATPDLYVHNMVAVFREVRRVLRADGTCWLNLGDSYAGSYGNQGRKNERGSQRPIHGPMLQPLDGRYPQRESNTGAVPAGLKSKDLVGIPWRVAFALQADGWYLRSDIVWSKPNPMPESVTDRPTKAHEYVFLLTRSPKYWFDQEAVREPSTGQNGAAAEFFRPNAGKGREGRYVGGRRPSGNESALTGREDNPAGRNVRSVWEIATQPYSEAHFATFPEELVRRCLLAGCPEMVCGTCGTPRSRIVESRSLDRNELPRDHPEWRPSRYDNGKAGDPQSPGPGQRFSDVSTVGWSDCGHNNWTTGTVLDPFMGSGTTALVARRHGRKAIGIELSADYAELAARRLQQLSLLAEGAA